MRITINQKTVELPDNASVADALAQWQPKPPFAVAVNTEFVPKSHYLQKMLVNGDKLEVIAPVTGG